MKKVLALKYRPRKFADIVGNEFVVAVLRNSVSLNKMRNAYFMAGGKGSGKTSTARIFAKAINCTGRGEMDPEPCCECLSCIEVDREVMMGDVQEVDAASQNSVASIKSLINQIQYAPQNGKMKVIILDEVHMLSSAASNALLKTLEEPPDHAVFIFCTTDPQKVLDTVRSRALYLEFQKLPPEEISNRLLFIAGQENIDLAADAATLVANAVNGGMRDAITILDQASILSSSVTTETITKIIGFVSPADLYELFSHIYAATDDKALAWLDKMVNKLDQDIITSCLHFIETLILINIGADVSRRLPAEAATNIKKLSSCFNMKQLYSMGEVAKETLQDYRRLSLRDNRVLLRLMIVGMTLAKDDKHNDAKALRRPIHELVTNGRQVKLDISGTLRRLFNAEQVEVDETQDEMESL